MATRGSRQSKQLPLCCLTLVRGVGQDLLVASQAGVEHNLAHCTAQPTAGDVTVSAEGRSACRRAAAFKRRPRQPHWSPGGCSGQLAQASSIYGRPAILTASWRAATLTRPPP